MDKNKSNTLPAFFSMIIGLLFMSFAAIFVKKSSAPGMVTTFYRMAIGSSVLVFPFIFHIIRNKPFLSFKGILLAMAGGFCFASDMALWSTGVVISNATIPTLFANIAPLWAGIGSVIIFKEKHNKGFWAGLILALSGIIIIMKNDFYAGNGILKGALLGLSAGVFYGIFYLVAQAGRKLLDTLSFVFIFTITSAILLFIGVSIFQFNLTGYNPLTWKIFIAFGLGVQVIGWMFVNYSQGYIPASIVAPTLLGQPLLTAFLAVILLHEELTIWHITGGIVVLFGIYIVHFSKIKNKQ